MDSSLLGSSVHGILKARILEWFAISFSWDFSSGNKGRVYIVQQLTLSSSVVWTPEEDENELVALLQNRGLLELLQKMSWH